MEILSNSSHTIAEWVELYTDQLLSWAYHKTTDKELAQDLVQATFIAALHDIDKFSRKSEPQTWLFAILNNKINGHYRRRFNTNFNSDRTLETYFDNDCNWKVQKSPADWNSSSEHLLDNAEFNLAFENCIKKLPKAWIIVINLMYLEKKDSKDICNILDISTPNLWQILHRAKLQLRHCIELNWYKNKE